MKSLCITLSLFLSSGVKAHEGIVSASYWSLYMNASAPDMCVVEDGVSVDVSCCTGGDFKTEPIAEQFDTSCFVIPNLPVDGSSLMSYLGCNGAANEPTYGEACYKGGMNGGIIPNGTMVENTNPESIEMCGSSGCQFKVTGNGCIKIRDFSSLPGFEDDLRQVFLFMDEHCHAPETTEEPTSAGVSLKMPWRALGTCIAMLIWTAAFV